MTVRTSHQAAVVANAQHSNSVGTCQLNVRTWFDAPSVGDVDRDGDADAVDGWESEPKKYRVLNRNPDLSDGGMPIAFEGGSRGFGHRAFLMKEGAIRSTDMRDNRYTAGVTSTVTAPSSSAAIAIIEQQMGVSYLGASKTIDGNLIPNFKQVTPTPPVAQTRGKRIDLALRKLRKARALAIENHMRPRVVLLTASINSLMQIPTHDKKI